MNQLTQPSLTQDLAQACARHPAHHMAPMFWEQGEFVVLNHFVSQSVIAQLMEEVERVRPQAHRSYIPVHRKGGSASYHVLRRAAPSILSLYQSPAFIEWLGGIAGVPLQPCPGHDPHACALYFYTEPGDHVGWHYDTSYYNGARYTALLGLVDRSMSRLACRLHTREPGRDVQELSLSTAPGTLIFFNGDTLHHAVTPLGKGEERVVLTLEYVTDPTMSRPKRYFSNLKDAFAYFGVSTLFQHMQPRP